MKDLKISDMRPSNCLVILVFYLLSLACSNNENGEFPGIIEEPEEQLTIGNNRVSCENCAGFGEILEASDTQVFSAGSNKIWVFDYDAQGISLAQEVTIPAAGYINSITVKGSLLFIGFSDLDGTGSVFQYQQNGAEWQFITKYEIGRYQDNFGNDVSVHGSAMVVGANAVWDESFTEPNVDPGSIYIYMADGTSWSLSNEFYAQDSKADDWFGNDVVIWENVILASGLSSPLHIYLQDNNSWNLFSVEIDRNPTDIGNYDNTVLYYNEISGMHSFTINPDGSLTDLTVTAALDVSGGIDFRKNNISMIQDYALFGTFSGQLYLLHLENNDWTLSKTLGLELEEPITEGAIKLTAQYAFYSGYPPSSTTAYLYFESY